MNCGENAGTCCYECSHFTPWDDCMMSDFVGFCAKHKFAVSESIADRGCYSR